jgi:hypothetical protein
MKKTKKSPDKKIIVKVPDYVQKLSTYDLIKQFVADLMAAKTAPKQSVVRDDGFFSDPKTWPERKHVVLLVDNKVADVMIVQPKFAGILLSQPTFIEVTPETHQSIKLGSEYIENKFVHPLDDHKHED